MRAVIVSILCFLFLLTLATPDITWMNTNGDSPLFVYAAQNWGISHPTGQPLYTIISAILVHLIPSTNPFWLLAILSAAFASATAYVLYRLTHSVIAPILYTVAGVVISQATIPEIYTTVTFFMVLAYYFYTQRKLKRTALALSLALAVHHLAIFMAAGILLREWWMKKPIGKMLLITLSGGLWYAYIPLTTIWHPVHQMDLLGTEQGIGRFIRYFFSQGMVPLGISPLSQDMVNRLGDYTVVMLGSLSVIAPLAIWYMIKMWKRKDRLLLVLVILISLWYMLDLDPNTYTYLVPAIALVAIVVATQVTKFTLPLVYGALLVLPVIGLLAYDIDRNLDPTPTTARQFLTQLETLPEGSTVFTYNRGWEWLTTRLGGVHSEQTPFLVALDDYPEGLCEKENLYATSVQDKATLSVSIVPLKCASNNLISVESSSSNNRNAPTN